MKSYSRAPLRFLLALVSSLALSVQAYALIMGGKGNSPLDMPGWPEGAAVIFNHKGRVAWWEGPPFGGGQYHAECRGNAESFNEVLAQFAKLKVTAKRLYVKDGVGNSFWLNPNNEEDKKAQAEIDWRLMVWTPESWERLSKLPRDLNPTNKSDQVPPAEIQLFVGGNIRWNDVKVPDGIEVIDHRLESHGYTSSDGMVLEGTITDLASGAALTGRVELQEIKPKQSGGYDYFLATESTTDANGKWVIKNAPQGWFQVVVFADDRVPRVVGYTTVQDEPGWTSFPSGLAKSASVDGKITDDEGKSVADVQVRLANVVAGDDESYKSDTDYASSTDQEGNFTLSDLPVGSATINCYKEGYYRAGLGEQISIPHEETIELVMSHAAELEVTVLFGTPQFPDEYLVESEPEGGSAVGKWSGSAKIDEDGKVVFRTVPPGKYVLVGHPNPTTEDDKTAPLSIELFGGKSQAVTLQAIQ